MRIQISCQQKQRSRSGRAQPPIRNRLHLPELLLHEQAETARRPTMKRARAWLLAAVLAALLGCDGSISSGDRVLVSKCNYETGIREPQRYDVVVFKYPNGPIENNTPKNYIKRLLGLPGEIIAIFFGRLFHFATPPGAPLPHEDHKDNTINPKDLWKTSHMRVNDEDDRKRFDAGNFKILRKPPSVMIALRRIVYDNDYQAKDMKEFPRWAPDKGSGWKYDKQHGFHYDDTKAEKVDWLHYRHKVRPKQGPIAGVRDLKPELITDMMGYNSVWLDGWEQKQGANWVGDLMLECNVDALKGEGEFWMELSKGINRFQARWDLGSGVCTLFKLKVKEITVNNSSVFEETERIELDSKPTKLRGPGAYQVRFANIDARLTVWVDRELPFGDGKDYPPPEVKNGAEEKDLDEIELQKRRGPTENDLQPASIGANGASLEVSQVRLWRDTYYTVAANQSDVGVDFTNRGNWHQFRTMNFKTLYVQPSHYLCLGDNSQASSDGREWGLVPDRLMLGRALLVYYPFNRAGPIR